MPVPVHADRQPNSIGFSIVDTCILQVLCAYIEMTEKSWRFVNVFTSWISTLTSVSHHLLWIRNTTDAKFCECLPMLEQNTVKVTLWCAERLNSAGKKRQPTSQSYSSNRRIATTECLFLPTSRRITIRRNNHPQIVSETERLRFAAISMPGCRFWSTHRNVSRWIQTNTKIFTRRRRRNNSRWVRVLGEYVTMMQKMYVCVCVPTEFRYALSVTEYVVRESNASHDNKSYNLTPKTKNELNESMLKLFSQDS